MSTISAGLVNVTNLTVTGTQSGAVTATNLGIGGTLDIGGNFSVDGNTVLNTLEVDGNTVLNTLDVSGNLTVQGNANIVGTVIPNFLNLPPIDPTIDWEGLWRTTDLVYGTPFEIGSIAIVKESNNTYTLYTNSTNNYYGSAATNYDYNTKYQPYYLIITGLVPVFTQDASGVITENSLTIPYSGNTSYFPYYSSMLTRKLTQEDKGSNFAFSIAGTRNGQANTFGFLERVILPSDVGIEEGCSWFTSYQTIYNRKLIESKDRTTVFDDLPGMYEVMKETIIDAYGLSSYNYEVISGEKRRVHKHVKSAFIIENLHEKLKTSTLDFAMDVNYIHRASLAKPNVITFHYDFLKKYESSPLVSPFSEITIVNKLLPTTPVIGDIPSSFKFLPSIVERSNCRQNWTGIPSPEEWFADNYIGIRLPLDVSGDKILTFVVDSSSNTDVIPGTYSVTIPSGYYYPHQLASTITGLMDPDSGIRVDFYTNKLNYTTQQAYLDSSLNSFYYISSGNQLVTVDVSCNDTSFLTNVLGLNTIIPEENPVPSASIPTTFYLNSNEIGGFPVYSYNGHLLDINNLWTPQSIPDSSNVQVCTTLGNVLNSNNPRDYYNCLWYFLNISQSDEQAINRQCVYLADIDEEMYMPDTWEEAQLKFVNFQAKFVLKANFYQFDTTNTNISNIGLGADTFFDHAWNGSSLFSVDEDPEFGVNSMMLNKYLYASYQGISLQKFLKPEAYNHVIESDGYSYKNYLDSSNCYTLAIEFISTTTDLSEFIPNHWVDLYNHGNLPSDVTVVLDTSPDTSGNDYKLFPLYDIPDNTSTRSIAISIVAGFVLGIFKQSVVNQLIPDASGSIVGYVRCPTGETKNFRFSEYREHIVLLFNGLGVKYCVCDWRNHLAGTGTWSFDLMPFGIPEQYNKQPLLWTFNTGSKDAPKEIQNVLDTNTIMADIWDHPEHWPPSWAYTNDTTGGGIDFTKYIETGDKYDILEVRERPDYQVGRMTVDGSSNGMGTFGFNFLIDSQSQYSCKSRIITFKNYSDDSDRNGITDCSNVYLTMYGNQNVFSSTYDSIAGSNWDYAMDIIPGSGSVNDNGMLFPLAGNLLYGNNCSYTGEPMNNRWGPWYKQDAIANHTPNTMCTEVGVYFDGSGNQQIYTHPSHNDYYVSNDKPASYRDFKLERSLQCAWAGRSGCRDDVQFGYMPYDDTDPYNHNVVDASSPLPFNLFSL